MSFWKNLFKTHDMVEQEFRDRETEQILQKAKEKREAEKAAKPKKPRKPKSEKAKSPKDLATEKGESYIHIVSVELDEKNIGSGSFELDWNDLFIKELRAAGYPGKTDEDVVDNWFREVCKNVYNETWEQEQAQKTPPDNVRYINRTFTSDGRTEVS